MYSVARTSDLNLEGIRCIHEEADIRLALHCQHTKFEFAVPLSRDTDVLLLLLAHSSRKKEVHMKIGAS